MALEKMTYTCSARLLQQYTHDSIPQIIKDMLRYRTTETSGAYKSDKWIHCVFSYNERHQDMEGDGEALVKFIEKHKLGKVLSTDWELNPNSGYNVKMCIWTVDWKAMQALQDSWDNPKPVERLWKKVTTV